MHYQFGGYLLDIDRQELRSDGAAIPIRPKAFELLAYLLANPDRVVSKDEILQHVWANQFIGDATLNSCLREVRQAVGDDGQAQQVIATMRGRGYRVIVPVQVQSLSPDSTSPLTPEDAGSSETTIYRPPYLVGRGLELQELQRCFDQARGGERQVVFVTGEPGIGKTTLIDAFVADLTASQDVWVISGQCIEDYGAGEPYMPILEALGRLCREVERDRIISVLRRQAPTWLVQLPWLLHAADRDLLQQELQGSTRPRMLRELTECLEALSVERTLLLILEDLHWSDGSTLEWLSHVARRPDRARLLILGSYRPAEAMGPDHPISAVTQELRQRGQCVELALDYLLESGIAAYLAQRFGASAATPSLVRLLHQRTQGNPLFLTAMIEAFIRQEIMVHTASGWHVQDALETAATIVPSTLRQLVEHHLLRLESADQSVLEAASVAGATFSAAMVAAGLSQSEDAVEAQCQTLARHGQFVREAGVETWPDGAVTTVYRFIHSIYHDVVYTRISAGRQTRLHRLIAARLEAAYADHLGEAAAQLAFHHHRGRDYAQAVHYHDLAAQYALGRSGYQETIAHANAGLALLPQVAETGGHTQQAFEFDLYMSLGPALMAIKGYGDRDVERAYARARELCRQLGEETRMFPVLWGLWRFYNSQGDFRTARQVGHQLLDLAQDQDDPSHRLAAHQALGFTLFYLGELTSARTHLEAGIALIDPEAQLALANRYGSAPGVTCLALVAQVLWALGYADQALQRCREACALANALAHPHSQVSAHFVTARVHLYRREPQAVHEHTEALMAFATEHSFAQRVAAGQFLRGWSMVMQNHDEAGMTQMRRGLDDILATGAVIYQPLCLLLLADAYGKTHRTDQGLQALSEALAIIGAEAQSYIAAELYRLQGDLLMRHAPPQIGEAERCFQQALELARRQQAKAWELRAAISLYRLWWQQDKSGEARELLSAVYHAFTEGFSTPDLREAQALLTTI